MVTTPSPLLSIVYSSVEVVPFGAAELTALIAQSQTNNARAGLTGWLLHRNGRFLQVLEGPEDVVQSRMAVIAADNRHTRVRTLIEEPVDRRSYPDWTMEYEPATAAVANAIPGYGTVFAELDAEVDDFSETTPALRAMMGWFHARATHAW